MIVVSFLVGDRDSSYVGLTFRVSLIVVISTDSASQLPKEEEKNV